VQIVKDLTEQPQLLILGEKRINVLILNLELDKLTRNEESEIRNQESGIRNQESVTSNQ
jgi:hypothetical protein